ncbi:hypothetical protein L292_2809 [Acinetobacter junii CIP 107470 = MTCC 11364]|uniref:Uncharacterized protein n=1 Tax=Acinetobacter junii CIP 107470 = MTCC 11364 TaxID=1217666 RepID=S7WW61_ACIJU|nr:hypothetical protein L292_2809 [Acinetobacter junii CIP 107470 = MTCC 11364]
MSKLIKKRPKHQCYVELFADGAAQFSLREQLFKALISMM